MSPSRTRTRAVLTAVAALLLPFGVATAQPAAAATCRVRASDKALFCGNYYNTGIRPTPEQDRNGVPTATIDWLHSTFSYFKCYTVGQRHSGGNTIWYRTVGDVTGRWGYVPAGSVFTPTDPFRDANGTVARC